MMPPKQLVLAVLEGKEVDRLPVDLWYTTEIDAELKKYFGVDDEFELYKAMNLDKIVWAFLDYKPNPTLNWSRKKVSITGLPK